VHDTKERLSLFWIFALLNYLYADVVALFAVVGSPNQADVPHLPPWALLSSAVLMEIPIAMIVASRLLPFRANRLAKYHRGCNFDPCKRRLNLCSAFLRRPDAGSS
jgi:hypothetical protein